MNYNNIVGQSLLVDRLKEIINCSRVAHAYLFTGPEGVGKKTMANFFAGALLCRQGMGRPCGKCHDCKQYQTLNHPDIARIKLEKSSIGVDQIRGMQGEIKIKPYQSHRKVFIIENAEKMTSQAQNALLKTLEDPPGYIVIILLSTSPEAMLATVLSRCQQIRIRGLGQDDMIKILMDNWNVGKEEALIYHKISEGIPGQAIKLAQSDNYMEIRNKFFDLIYDLSEWRGADALSKARFFIDYKDYTEDLLDMLIICFRDILIYKETKDEKLIVNVDKITTIQSLSFDFTIKHIKDIIEGIEEAGRMLKGNANFQLAIENMLLRFQGGEG